MIRNRLARTLLSLVLLAALFGCQKNKTIALTVFTPPGIDTLAGVTKLNLFVDNSTTGLSLPIANSATLDQLVDVESDNQAHVLTIEALNGNDLVVARGRTRRIVFALDNQAAQLVLWPVDRCARIREALGTEWSDARFFLANQERIVAILGQQSRFYDIGSATFLDGPLLPSAIGAPVGMAVDDDTLLLIGSSSVTLRLSGNQTVTQSDWNGVAPNGDQGQLVVTGTTTAVVFAKNSPQAFRIDINGFNSTALSSLQTARDGYVAAAVGDKIWILGGTTTGPVLSVLDPGADTIDHLSIDPALLPGDLRDATITVLPDGAGVLVVGGQSAGQPRTTMLLLEAACSSGSTNGCVIATAELKIARGRHSVSLLPNDELLIAGGSNAAGAIATSEIWSLSAQALVFQRNVELTTARTGHTALRLGGHEIVIFGGSAATGELYQPR